MSKDFEGSDLMQHLMENIQDNIYFMDRKGRIVMINQAGARWLGFKSPDEVLGKTDLDIFTSEHGRAAYEDEQRIMRTGIPMLGKEEKETWADGRETWVSTSKMPLRSKAGEIVGTFGISRDITDRKIAEIRAARYAEENRRFREEMEDDLRVAAELQKTFFPTSYPAFSDAASMDQVVRFNHLHHPGAMVGGDLCSIRKLSDTEAGILLCDVMGHGVRAALGTAIVRAAVEEISHRVKGAGRFLRHMNQVLMPILGQGDERLFCTACYLVLDVSTGTISYANAGHPLPILLGAGTGRAAFLVDDRTSGGPALAIREDAEYPTVELALQPDDAVFMYTDGIFEVANADGRPFGEERLLAAAGVHGQLALAELFPSLVNEAREFSAESRFEDDVCLVGFRLCDTLDAG